MSCAGDVPMVLQINDLNTAIENTLAANGRVE
jgi:hypothetical protein